MDFSGYYDIATKRFTATLNGDASFNLPVLVAGEDATIRVKFKQSRDGGVEEINPEVVAMKAMIGQVDARPVSGLIKLEVDGEEFDTAILYDPEDADDDTKFEVVLKEALEELSSIAAVTVSKKFDSYILVFDDDSTIPREINVTFNTLFPSSFLHIRGYVRSGRYEYELRAVKAPVGYANTFSLGTGPLPEFTRLREGGANEVGAWREVQALYVPPSFTGTFRIKRGEMYSDPLSRSSTLEDYIEAIEPLKDPGGEWEVTLPVDNTIYFYFGGDMEGQTFALMEAPLFQAPAAENVISFTTKTRAMAEVMMEVDNAVLSLEVYALLKDLEDPTKEKWHCVLRRNVGVLESVDWDGLSVAPEIDWLNPPTLIRNRVFAPGQVSNGQIHYHETLGDGMLTTFEVTHGLDTPFVDVIIVENQEPGAKMVEGVNYNWTRDNSDQVTITWLTGTPTADQYTVTVLGLAQTSFFDAHGHTIEDIEGLSEWISTVENRFAMLLGTTGLGASKEVPLNAPEVARWELPMIFELYPSRLQPSAPGDGRLASVDLNEEGENGKKIINRGRGLLPAVHNAVVGSLPIPVPNAGPAYVGNVYQNNSPNPVSLGGGYGLKTQTLAPGGYAACDGRIWYPVVPHGRWQPQAFSVDYEANANKLTFTNALAEMLAEGSAVEVASTGTLPAGLSSGTTYYVRQPDFAARTCMLALTPGGAAIELTTNGTGTHSMLVEANITYYPVHFEKNFAVITVNEKQLRPSKDLYIGFAFEAILLRNNVDAQLAVMVEIGEARKTDTDGRENDNLEEIVWRRVAALEQVVVLSALSTTHKFGLRVSRRVVNGVEKISAMRMVYGSEEFDVVPPRTANFLVRLSMGKFDTSDGSSDPRGLLMFSGLKIDKEDGSPQDAIGAYEMGAAYIK